MDFHFIFESLGSFLRKISVQTYEFRLYLRIQIIENSSFWYACGVYNLKLECYAY